MAAFALAGRRVLVAGHRGMVGSALVRRLASEGCAIVTAGRGEVDLRRQDQVEGWMAQAKPDVIVMAAGRTGGILANDSRPADFLFDNLMMAANVTEAAFRGGVDKLLFLGSSCIYPKLAEQPMRETALLTGALEPTNQWYAVAKIAGLKLAQAYRRQHGSDFIAAMPCNLYGPGDRYDPASSHVLPALIRRAHEAKRSGAEAITVWGTGAPRREFLHADDCADALVFLLKTYSGEEPVNVGCGTDVTISELARLVCDAVGFTGRIVFDPSKPDGTPRKLMDSGKLAGMGWKTNIALEEGIRRTYADFLSESASQNLRERQ